MAVFARLSYLQTILMMSSYALLSEMNVEPTYFELYNVKEDREERIDVAKEHPELVERMKAKMLLL